MVHHKGTNMKFLLLLFVLVSVCVKYDFQFVSGEIRCSEKERDALLVFKEGLIDDSGVLASWGREEEKKECCEWLGIVCSIRNTTHHVTGLLLRNQKFFDFLHNHTLGGKISSALLELHHLNDLDLSGNNFGGYQIPEFIGSMKQLQYLHLNESSFSGIIPPQFGNLTNLQTLDLSNNDLRSDNLNWLSHLSLLSRLDLSDSNLSDTNWLHQVLKPRSLQELHLHRCMLDVTSFEGLFINSSSTSLSILDLSSNDLTSSTFDWLFNVSTSLVTLDLQFNQLEGPIPNAFENFIFLEYLDFSNNALVGGIPKSLWNLSHLHTIILSDNDLGGSMPNFSDCSQLRELYLDNNKLTGSVPESLGQFSKLEELDFNFNSLEGTISEVHFMKLHSLKSLCLYSNSLALDLNPDWVPPFQLETIVLSGCKMGPSFPKWLQTQTKFTSLDISAAGISDEVPKWFWNLSPEVIDLNLSHNQMSGTIPDLSDFTSNSKDLIIDVSYNNFSGPLPLPPPNIGIYLLSQNMFSGPVSSICSISHVWLVFLDLANNKFGGELPNCWGNTTNLGALHLNNNNFSGEIPHTLGSLDLESLHLGGNNLSGEFPSALKNCRSLGLIDIGGNKLTGNIPSWLGGNYPEMTYLSLRRNRFHGDIPPEICSLTQIQILDLSENNISGKIPECFNNFTALVDKNKRTASSVYIDQNEVLYFHYDSVQWKGQELEYRKTLEFLKLIDLSSNKLVGEIPRAFSCFKGLISLNLSRNNLTGSIDPNIGQMEMLEILDLSRNQLSSEIPVGLTQLHFLAILDLSNNNLCGKIPLGTQLQGFNTSAYAGNSELCGPPLGSCPGDHPIPPTCNQGEDVDTDHDKTVWFLSTPFLQVPWISIILGFIVGFWGIIGSLLFKKSWRRAYFNFWDDVGDWLYVTATIFFRKFKRN